MFWYDRTITSKSQVYIIEKSIKTWTINLAEAAPTPPEQPGVGARPAKNLYDFYLFCLLVAQPGIIRLLRGGAGILEGDDAALGQEGEELEENFAG
jgi:hypothetical protein